MTLLVGAVGWSLFAFGALVHIWHYDRFGDLVSLHFDPAVGDQLRAVHQKVCPVSVGDATDGGLPS